MIFSGCSTATCSMSIPPSVLAMMMGRDRARSRRTAQYNSFLIRGAAATRTLLTRRPSGPVCLVTRTLPSMALALSKASPSVLQSFTPPLKPFLNVPLPRPPAWIWALTTTTVSPLAKSWAANSRAAPASLKTSAGGSATPYWARSCLAWYSWMFTGWLFLHFLVEAQDVSVLGQKQRVALLNFDFRVLRFRGGQCDLIVPVLFPCAGGDRGGIAAV